MTSQMFSAIAAVTGQGQNPNTTPAQWGSSQYGYSGSTGGGGGSSSAYHVSAAFKVKNYSKRKVVGNLKLLLGVLETFVALSAPTEHSFSTKCGLMSLIFYVF